MPVDKYLSLIHIWVIYANFYEVTLPAESASFGNYRKIKAEELGQYAVPRLVHALSLIHI